MRAEASPGLRGTTQRARSSGTSGVARGFRCYWGLARSVDDPEAQPDVEVAEKIIDVLDGGVWADGEPHEFHEPSRAIPLEERAARAMLVYQRVRVLAGVLDRVA